MAVKLRMTRMGRRHRPFFRINAVESRTPRDGRIIEKLGHYDPLEKDEQKMIVLDVEKAREWIEKGAVPSKTVNDILRKHGIDCKYWQKKDAKRQRAKELARKAGKPFDEAERIAAQKAAEEAQARAEAEAKAAEEKAKAEAEAKAKAEEEAKAKAEAESAESSEESSE
jgi:small subunit ribosomal protein S16